MKHKGMTLIELIIVIAIFSIFSLAVYNYQSGELNVYKKQYTQTILQGDAKNAVEQITLDIKKSRLTPYSVETDFTDPKFQTLISTLGTSYKPIVYIDFLNTNAAGNSYNSCIYAVKQLTDGTKQLVKIFLKSNEFTLLNTNPINIGSEQYGSYNRDNYNQGSCTTFDSNNFDNNMLPYFQNQIDGLNKNNSFIYEEQGNYYLIYEASSDNSVVYQYDLKEESSNVESAEINEQAIVNNVASVQVIPLDSEVPNSENNSFNISVSLEKNITINGNSVTLNESFNSNATRIRYDGGDTNANN
jgi:prepilin-type N-terminal cleavage/methylation domain-containing protein